MASPERPLIARMTISHFRRCPTAHPDVPPLPTRRQPDIAHPPDDHPAGWAGSHPPYAPVDLQSRRLPGSPASADRYDATTAPRTPHHSPAPSHVTRPGGEGCGPSARAQCCPAGRYSGISARRMRMMALRLFHVPFRLSITPIVCNRICRSRASERFLM